MVSWFHGFLLNLFSWGWNEARLPALPLRGGRMRRQRGLQREEIGKHGFRLRGAKLRGVVGAGRDAPAGEAAVVCGLHIEGRVADEERRFGAGAELREGVRGEFRLRLQPRRVPCAKHAAQKGRDAEVRADFPGVVAAFVGEDRELDTRGLLSAEQLKRAGHQRDVLQEDPVGKRHVQLDGAGNQRVGHEVAHGVFQSAADGAAHCFHGGRGQPELWQHVDVAAMNGREGVDDGSVQIEEQRGVARHERRDCDGKSETGNHGLCENHGYAVENG